MNEIQTATHSVLKPLGFRKSGRSHNRTVADGIIQVVNFQMGAYPIGDYEVPGFRTSQYGKFSVNLGVLIPCVHRLYSFPLPKTIIDAHCSIRGHIQFDDGNGLFEITTPDISSKMADLVLSQGLSFFHLFETYSHVLEYYQCHGDLPFQNHHRASLEAAVVAHELGRKELSEQLFREARDTNHRGFQSRVAEVATKLGYDIF